MSGNEMETVGTRRKWKNSVPTARQKTVIENNNRQFPSN